MTFQPIIPLSGNAGWAFLQKTRTSQQDAFNRSPEISRNENYFREKISAVSSAEELVNDRQLLSVALGAFGLSDDINNKFFIQKVLSEGTLDPDSFANRLADKRYFELSKAFGLDLSPPNTSLNSFVDEVAEAYKNRSFETAVGEVDSSMRLALGAERDLATLAQKGQSETVAWFSVMGNPPLRRVFELALGLPEQIGALDVDRQLEVFRDKASRVLGSTNPADFADPEGQRDLISKFLLREQIQSFGAGQSSRAVALSLLQSAVR